MSNKLRISLCEFMDGTFDLYLIDHDTSEEIQITGKRKFTEPEREMIERLMPACVWTTYQRVERS